ncbi:MAG: Laccase domain protein yfiH [Pseudomonadota bacterium]|jgi:copper oxidase (laccase) domain-containing protein
MNPRFEIVDHNGVQLLVYRPWWEEGILHGMTLGPISFGGDALLSSAGDLCRATGLSMLANPQQTHGDQFFDARSAADVAALLSPERSLLRFGEYDGVIAPPEQNVPGERVGYAIATADCVPVVLRGSSGWGLIHAGWRGLANGIIGRVAYGLGEVVEAVIFACAGGERYEVGSEVVEAIGETASYRNAANGKFLLDTAETAAAQIRTVLPAKPIERSGICTIGDTRFHSHRRDGERAGRSITFVSPSL